MPTTTAFSWVQVPLPGVTLQPKKYYWVGILPSPTAATGDAGVILGATSDKDSHRIPMNNHRSLLRVVSLLSAENRTDAAGGCASQIAADWLARQSNWQEFGRRFRRATSNKRAGVELIGIPA